MPQQIQIQDDDHIAVVNVADMDKLRAMQDVCAEIKARTNSKGDVTPLASIPWEMHQRFFDLKGITLQDYMRSPDMKREFLNSPEVQGFRLWRGRL
jgi:CRISPR/Cas system CSM-associated protein Csm5 (group 7 of RAMP superfamily)